MISDVAWLFASGILALAGVWAGWWIGIRWLGLLFLGASTILVAAIWGVVFDWVLAEELGSYAKLAVLLGAFTGAIAGASASLLGLGAFHILRRREQSRHLHSALLGVGDSGIDSDSIRRRLLWGCTFLVAATWTALFYWMRFFHPAPIVAAAVSVGLLCLVYQNVRLTVMRRHSRPSQLGSPDPNVRSDGIHLPPGGTMERVEASEHVKYAPYSKSDTDVVWFVYEDWFEALNDPAGAAETYLLIPHRTRVRFSPGVSPKLSNSFDCVVFQRGEGGDFRATPASRSPFCRRVMKIIRTARREATNA